MLDFIDAIEEAINKKAIRNFMPIQKGDVPVTWADTSLLNNLTNYNSKTHFRDGVNNFVKWYLEFYNHKVGKNK